MNYVVYSSLNTDEPIMLINRHIGQDDEDGPGIIGDLFQNELLELDGLGKKRIQVWINSPGGSVVDGYAIYNAILKSKTPVDTYCVGIAASIAGVLFQAGRKRVMCDYGILMYHNPFGGDPKTLSAMKDSLIKMISNRCGMSENDVAGMMARTTYISAEEAMDKGLCDEIESSLTANIKYKRTDANPVMNYWKESTKVLNSFLQTEIKPIQMAFPKVTMKLGLNDSAPENDVVAAITAIENRANAAEGTIAKLQTNIQDKETELTDVKNKLTAAEAKIKDEATVAAAKLKDVQDKLTAMETDKKAAEEATTKLEAETMVEGHAKAGRIKNEATVKLQWVKMAIADLPGTKAMLEALPLNKVATKITEAAAAKVGEGELPTSAIGLMARNKLKREGKA